MLGLGPGLGVVALLTSLQTRLLFVAAVIAVFSTQLADVLNRLATFDQIMLAAHFSIRPERTSDPNVVEFCEF